MSQYLFVDHAPRVAGSVIILVALAYILLPLRFYTRIKNKTWGMDDTCMAIATVPFTVLSVFCLGGSFKGIGTHEYRMSQEQITEGMMWFFFFECFYCGAIIPIKLSISFMLMRIASPMRTYVISLYCISVIFTIMNLIAFFYIVFHCHPVKQAWAEVGGKCDPPTILADIYYATTVINIITDWFCAILPVPLLWSVQLNRNAKLSVAALLSLGVFASLSACIRLNYTIKLTYANDYLFNVGDIVIWGYAENGIGVIVGCISTLRPLFRRVFHLGGSTNAPPGKQEWPTNSRRAYQECEGSYELRTDKVNALATVQARGSSSVDDSASEEHILKDVSGIQISRTVLQEASYKTNDSPL